ncbi:hypothetical protein T10_7751 [Trichinella papuae]|uniref:Uncharacterized protein n=1 Tax=Trichinella papuae TaxID=268474 RepID=A0A0V1MVW5_9BILA|nr:hypothetical protein T10_7751 [Trichinella papuae]
MTFPNGIVGTFSPENSIAAQCIVTLSTVCPFLFVNMYMRDTSVARVDCGCRPSQGRKRAFIVDPTLSANCYCPRMAGSERAVPILFSHLLKFFLHCRLTGFMYDLCVTHLGEAGNVLRGLKMASLVALLNKRRISVLLVLANCVPVRVDNAVLCLADQPGGSIIGQSGRIQGRKVESALCARAAQTPQEKCFLLNGV